ncbi:hypothetical protein [Shimia biformata]|uniref:hypothetical protein n=1 Tax=Shimia biformata TaxID=1294299 RepID=UPI0019505F0F|nr:hypothetical protein [Shimia biformata]
MPRQNRVLPTGEITAQDWRGAFMGNRGNLHDGRGLTHRRWRHRAWVCCVLDFKNRRRPIMAPGAYTELFFHDEAVALAAGHRPCGECRREDFNAFLHAAGHHGRVTGFDDRLHAARAVPRTFGQRRDDAQVTTLPDGTFILTDTGPALLWQDAMRPYLGAGYGPARPKPTGRVTVLTPEPTRVALANGYCPKLVV